MAKHDWISCNSLQQEDRQLRWKICCKIFQATLFSIYVNWKSFILAWFREPADGLIRVYRRVCSSIQTLLSRRRCRFRPGICMGCSFRPAQSASFSCEIRCWYVYKKLYSCQRSPGAKTQIPNCQHGWTNIAFNTSVFFQKIPQRNHFVNRHQCIRHKDATGIRVDSIFSAFYPLEWTPNILD